MEPDDLGGAAALRWTDSGWPRLVKGRAATVARVMADQTKPQTQPQTQPQPGPRLTSLSPGAGCACKLPLAKLEALFASMGDGSLAHGPGLG